MGRSCSSCSAPCPPESVGYSTPRLEALRAWLKTLDTKTMFVAVHGQEIFEYRNPAHASKIASVRKRMGAPRRCRGRLTR